MADEFTVCIPSEAGFGRLALLLRRKAQ